MSPEARPALPWACCAGWGPPRAQIALTVPPLPLAALTRGPQGRLSGG